MKTFAKSSAEKTRNIRETRLLRLISLSLPFSKCESPELALILLKLQHGLLNAVFHNKSEHGTGSRLSKAVNSVNCLIFDGRCPPGVCKNYLVRGDKVHAN